MEFAEYRQPWETGPHWELKREFLEYYKDKFPVDRLLCLAQAYSNIELLQCSYPNQVMFQIHELSKPLKECKRFKASGNSQSNNQKQQGKRKNNEPASAQKFKFIKFCSENEDLPKQETKESNCELPQPDSIDFDAITSAENFNVISKLSEEVKKILKISKENAYDVILSAALNTNMEDLIDLKFTNQASLESVKYYCEFCIGATKIALGDGDDRFSAKSKASENALKNLKELSKKNLDDAQMQKQVIQHCNMADNHKELFKALAVLLKKYEKKDCNSSLHNCCTKLKIVNELTYKFIQDRTQPKKQHLFLCDLFLKNILIGQGEGSKMKIAKAEASKSGCEYLENFLDGSEISSDNSTNNHQTIKNNKNNQTVTNSFNLREDTPNDSSSKISDIIRKPISINKELLNNSYKEQFLLVDRNEDSNETIPVVILSHSAQRCRKTYSYNYVNNDDGTIRAEVLLDQKVVGIGSGQTKQIAKTEAAQNALDNLKKQVYTVKVKPGPEDGFQISRSEMVELKCEDSEVVAEDNIGCRMLRMMGWSGGGIGKKKGIIEPICAGKQNYGTGLGYSSPQMDMKNWKYKIETMLKEFSKSNAIIPLIFSSDFTKAERSEIHRVAQKYNLYNHSFGKNENRRLFVKRKISVTELLDVIVKAGGSTETYELVDISS